MSAYRIAFEKTISAINRRAANHRNLVVTTSFVIIIAIILAIAGQTFKHLSFAVVLVPISGGFFFHDWIILQRWRNHVLGEWNARKLELGILKSSILELPHLPESTRDSMLSTLPETAIGSVELEISRESRQLISQVILTINASRGDLALFHTAIISIVAGCVVASLYSASLVPLAGCLLIAVYPIVKSRWIMRKAHKISDCIHNSSSNELVDTELVQQCLSQYKLAPFNNIKLAPVKIS